MSRTAFPVWLRRPWPGQGAFPSVKDAVKQLKLHTVCQSAHCPNLGECWARGTATFMVLGNVCTRHCAYCAVWSGKPSAPDPLEPQHVAEAVAQLSLRHVVITSVSRDDLLDGGASHIASVIAAIKKRNSDTTVEVLVQDFGGNVEALKTVLAAEPEVFSHNIETVERIFPKVRDRRFHYRESLAFLAAAAEHAGTGTWIKSAFMLGLGETDEEVRRTLYDLRAAGCVAVALGQYLQPTPKHHEVVRYVAPEEFARWEAFAYEIGFAFAVAGPFVRSSYRSEQLIEQMRQQTVRMS